MATPLAALAALVESQHIVDMGGMNKDRPAHVKPPAYLSASPPVPEPQAVAPERPEAGGPKGLEPIRYGDWENNGIAWDF